MNSRVNKNENVKKIKAVTRRSLDGKTVDIFEAVDDKFVDEKIFNDVTKTKWAEATDTCQISDVKHGYSNNDDFLNL